MNLENRVIIVTGAASGVGRESVKLLLEAGARVMACDIDETGLRSLEEECRDTSAHLRTKVVDVSKAEAVKELIDSTLETFGTLNGMFNNAGIRDGTHFDSLDPDLYHEHLDTNQHSVFYGMHYAARAMQRLGVEGTIVNTASIRSYFGAQKSFRYSAAKAAVVSMTKSGADALAKDNIRVVGVAPAFIDTGLLESVPEERRERLKGRHLRGKLLEAEEVARVVRFLFSDESVAINGATILADDGYLAVR